MCKTKPTTTELQAEKRECETRKGRAMADIGEAISEVADRVSHLHWWDDVNELLNCWIRLFARKRTGRRGNPRK